MFTKPHNLDALCETTWRVFRDIYSFKTSKHFLIYLYVLFKT